MDRREELLSPIDALLAVHDEWQKTDNPELSRDLTQSIEDAILVFSGGDMPGDLLPLYTRMKAIDETWTEVIMRADDPDHILSHQAGSFWKALDSVRQLRQQAESEETEEIRPLESVAVLTKQGVGDEQICRIYKAAWPEGAKSGPGLWDWRKNRPNLAALEQERQKPGSIIGADFVPWFAAQKKQQAEDRRKASDRAAAIRQERIAKMHKPCPEPLSQLIEEGVDIDQIARMKKTTKQAIRDQCVKEKLPMPKEPESITSEFDPKPNEAQRRIEQANRQQPAKAETIESAETIVDDEEWDGSPTTSPAEDVGEPNDPITARERLVAKWMDTGGKPREIVKAIQDDGGPEITIKEVSAIVGRLKGDPDRMKLAMAE